ncbi:hypothetical protein K1719_047136 [Acacia pycnantha]|nr:hypothetical protein K1719_047136 [Acacia pycnantha]
MCCWQRVTRRNAPGGRSSGRLATRCTAVFGGGTPASGCVKCGSPIRRREFGWVRFPADMAARASDVAAIALRGQLACLNFADSTWRLPLPASTEVKDIQKAAAEAAEAFRPGTESERDELRLENAEATTSSAAAAGVEQSIFLIDEEVVLAMPELLSNMKDAVLMSPTHDSFEDMYDGVDVEVDDAEMLLWSYSF